MTSVIDVIAKVSEVISKDSDVIAKISEVIVKDSDVSY